MVSIFSVIAFLAVFTWYGLTVSEFNRRAQLVVLFWAVFLVGFNLFWITAIEPTQGIE